MVIAQTIIHRLAKLRTRLAAARGSHMVLGAGCSCGLAADHIDVSAVDSMIGIHLADKYQAAGREELGMLLNRAKNPGALASALTELIEGIIVISDKDAATLCDDLEISVSSLEEATGSKVRGGPRIESL